MDENNGICRFCKGETMKGLVAVDYEKGYKMMAIVEKCTKCEKITDIDFFTNQTRKVKTIVGFNDNLDLIVHGKNGKTEVLQMKKCRPPKTSEVWEFELGLSDPDFMKYPLLKEETRNVE